MAFRDEAGAYPLGYPISAVHSVQTKLEDACGGRPPLPGMAALQIISLALLAFRTVDLHNNDRNEESHQDEEYSHSIQVRHCGVEQTDTHTGDPRRNLSCQLVIFPNLTVEVSGFTVPIFEASTHKVCDEDMPLFCFEIAVRHTIHLDNCICCPKSADAR